MHQDFTNYFSLCSDQIPKRINFREEGSILAYVLRTCSLMVEKAWPKEMGSHTESLVRKQRKQEVGSVRL